MGKLQLTGQNLGQIFNSRNGRVDAVHFLCYGVKLPNLKLKTWPKQPIDPLRELSCSPCIASIVRTLSCSALKMH
jgi:hypothetical protein